MSGQAPGGVNWFIALFVLSPAGMARAGLDTAASVYLPLLEETAYMPTMKYVFGDEIFQHAKRISIAFGLYQHAMF